MYKYLTKEQLKGLNQYKYSAIDTSPLSQYVMHPTWNALVKVVPKSVAPNLITFEGFLCMVTAVFLLSIYDYDFYAAGGRPNSNINSSDIPNWLYILCGFLIYLAYNLGFIYMVTAVFLLSIYYYDYDFYAAGGRPNSNINSSDIPNWLYILCGFLIFLAYNLDGIDGKQARRIGVSGPLGELFDHGLDSYIVFLIPYTIISIFGRDLEYSVSCFRGFLIVMSVVLNFYISHWEKYNTGTLYLPWGYDLSMWVCTILFILEGVYGPGYFKFYIFKGYTFARVFEVVIHLVGLLTTLPVAIYNVYVSYKTRSGRMYSISGALKPLSSLYVVTVVMVFWGLYSKNDIVEVHPRAFIFLYGTLFSNIASRLIIAEMCRSRCELVNWLSWPLVAGVMVSFNQPFLESTVLHALLTLAVFAHVHYGVCVVRQICEHLQIQCFTVPKEKKK